MTCPQSWSHSAVEPGFTPISVWLQSLHLGSLPEPDASCSEEVHIPAPTGWAESFQTFFTRGAESPPHSSWAPFCLWPGGVNFFRCHQERTLLHSVSWLAGGRGSCWAGTLQGSHDQEGAEHKAQGHRLAFQEQSDSPAWEASYLPRALVGTPWGFQQLPKANPVQQVFKPSRAFYHASLNSSSLCSLAITKATSTSVGVCYSNTPFPGSRICVSFLGLL